MWILRIVLLIFFVGFLSAQQPSPASVEGVVVRFESNDPLAGATVELRTMDSGVGVVTTTDGNGKFLVPNVQPGEYRLLATRSRFVRTEYGQSSAGELAKPLVVHAGQRLTGLRLVMTPGGVITGRVLDKGQPKVSTHVAAGTISYGPDGRRAWKKVLSGATNDLGEYHIFWLPPGRYYVIADTSDTPRLPPPYLFINPGGADNPLLSRGNSGLVGMQRSSSLGPVFSRTLSVISDTEMHLPIFFPSTPEWREATAIEISPGAEIRNVDIDASPVPALHVRGTVTGAPATNPQGQPLRAQITLFSVDSVFSNVAAVDPVAGTPSVSVQADPGGTFDLPRIRRGTYLLRATAGNLTARVPVEVRDRDLTGITLALASGLTVSGRVIVEGSNVVNLNVGLLMESVDRFTTATPRPAADGSFTIPVPQTGDYRVFVRPILLPLAQVLPQPLNQALALAQAQAVPPAVQSAYVKSITLEGVDVLNDGLHLTGQPRQPLIITIGTNAGSLEGRVMNGQQPVSAATVVLIPENGQRFHVNHKFTVGDEAGRFQIPSVPPGNYKLFAWESIELGAWQNADFMRDYESKGKLVHIDEGAKAAVELRPIP